MKASKKLGTESRLYICALIFGIGMVGLLLGINEIAHNMRKNSVASGSRLGGKRGDPDLYGKFACFPSLTNRGSAAVFAASQLTGVFAGTQSAAAWALQKEPSH